MYLRSLDLCLERIQPGCVSARRILRAICLGLGCTIVELSQLELLGQGIANLLLFPRAIEGLVVFLLRIVQGDLRAF